MGGDFANGKHKREWMRESACVRNGPLRKADLTGAGNRADRRGKQCSAPTNRSLETVFGCNLFGFLVDQK